MKKFIIVVLFSFVFGSCGHFQRDETQSVEPAVEDDAAQQSVNSQQNEKQSTMRNTVESDIQRSAAVIEDAVIAMKTYSMSASQENYLKVINLSNDLNFDFQEEGLTPEERSRCVKQKFAVDSMKMVVDHWLQEEIGKMRLTLVQKEDCLIEEVTAYPVYLQKGVKLYIDLEMQGNKTTRFYNADSKKLLKTYQAKNKIHDSIKIENTAIYLVEITPNGSQYIDLLLQQSVNTPDQFSEKQQVKVETVDASVNDFRAKKFNTISLINVFEEPRKITLRSQLKSIISGNYRSVVAVQVPSGANDIAYCLRISTSEQNRGTDGQFFKDMESSYRQIKFFGLPVYESTTSKTSILRELLNRNRPPAKEEDAYCNLYVFTNSDMARRFQNQEDVTKLKYNIDLSSFGTQSCNGRIPCKGLKTIYLGFENERSTKSVYLWLEVIATVPTVHYSKEQYSL